MLVLELCKNRHVGIDREEAQEEKRQALVVGGAAGRILPPG